MLSSGVILALGGTLLLVVADNVPSLNVEPACRAAAKMGDSLSLDTTLRQCLADEKSARDQLEKEWTQFTPALRQRCVATHADRRRPQLCRSARVPADGARRRPDPTQLTMTQIVNAFVSPGSASPPSRTCHTRTNRAAARNPCQSHTHQSTRQKRA